MTQQGMKQEIERLTQRKAELHQQAAAAYTGYQKLSKEALLGLVSQQYRVHSCSLKSPKSELIYALTSAQFGCAIERIEKNIKHYQSKLAQ